MRNFTVSGAPGSSVACDLLPWVVSHFVAAASFGQQVPCNYSIAKIDASTCAPSDAKVTPYGIGVDGCWVGYVVDCAPPGYYHAVSWSPEGGTVSLPLPPGTAESFGVAINGRGTIVGTCDNRAVVWRNRAYFEIPTIDGGWSGSSAINDSDTVVGAREVPDGQGGVAGLPFIWKDGAVTDLDVRLLGFQGGYASAVSNTEFVVGDAYIGQASTGFRWQNGTLTLLQPLPGAPWGYVVGVSDSGVAVGNSRFVHLPGFDGPYLPTIWSADGTPEQLPLLPGYLEGSCVAVNASGVILGQVTGRTDPRLPYSRWVVWIDRVAYPITPRIPSSTASAFVPYDLNASGQIIGVGPVSRPGVANSVRGVWIISPQPLLGDLNGDCQVNGPDLALLLNAWGPAAPGAAADLNADGIVDGADLGTLLSAWGTTP